MYVIVFPGQGSQIQGMGKFLYDNFTLGKQIFEEASDAISFDLKKLCFDGADADLSLTENTQPALVCVSTATQRILRGLFDFPVSAVAGHSVGEYSALVCAESISLRDAVKSVRVRGRAMQSAVPVGEGAMAAVLGLENDVVEKICQLATQKSGGGPLSPANFNSPGQTVISGSAKSIEWLKTQYSPEEDSNLPKRIKLIPLNVSAPFHCQLMKPAERAMEEQLGTIEIQDAKIPVVQNFTARLHYSRRELRENLVKQVCGPVLWAQSMVELRNQNLNRFVECGSGKVLQGILKKIDPEFQTWTTQSLDDFKILEQLFTGKSQ